MSAFVSEAFVVGIKEGIKISVCVLIALSFFRKNKFDYLRTPFFGGLLIVFLASFGVVSTQVTLEMRESIVKMVGYVFGIFYLFSLGALYHATGTDILGPLRNILRKGIVLVPLVFLLTALYFVPDMAGSSLFIGDLYSMSEESFSVFLASTLGFIVSALLFYVFSHRIGALVMRLFDLPQVLLFLALIKLVGGGVKGFAEISLIPSVQKGLMKLIHDMVHQTFLFLMVPDHLLLKVTAWNFIGIVFGEKAGLWLALVILLLPLFIFLRKHFVSEISVPSEVKRGAGRRKFIKAVRDERFLKSIPIFVFMVFILSTWFIEKGESVSKLHNPEPLPVIAEGGRVRIPISSPGRDLRDGMLHKFSVNAQGEDIRVLVMKKEDGTLGVCLDACEICPPDGYAQGEGHVICLYCMTPIAIDTLGQPGGCNPIPLRALVTDTAVEIELSEIAEKWDMVKTGKTKEQIDK